MYCISVARYSFIAFSTGVQYYTIAIINYREFSQHLVQAQLRPSGRALFPQLVRHNVIVHLYPFYLFNPYFFHTTSSIHH